MTDTAARAAAPPSRPALRPNPGPELSVVAPTFNERANVEKLVAKLGATLAGVAWEVIFVDDDSPDGTAQLVKELAAGDARVRGIRRVGRRGLAGAVIEGALASAAPYVAVIDADMQHDETLLPRMLAVLRGGETDLVVGSRYLDAAGLEQGLSPIRKAGSQLATALGKKALKADVSDPVSGFFMIRREAVERVAGRLEPGGFKILFDIIASQEAPLRIKELPYAFQAREAGESKMGGRVALEYLGLVAAKLSGDLISPRMVFFGLVGLSGVAVHMAVLAVAHALIVRFAYAQALAALTAMTSNYFVNNAVTYRDRRLKGWWLLGGYLRFCALCSVGFAANVAVAAELKAHAAPWWAAGLIGAACGAVWNYVSTYLGVW
ncbi:MAG TPA: glycosyltransferase family 2 protein [Caulobacteraceae bacterium]|nr:glycosyltransferase family 2 protein [Caulobacteraceae bacterium]